MNINDIVLTLFLTTGFIGWVTIKKQRLTEIKFFRPQSTAKWLILLVVICLVSSVSFTLLVPFQTHPSATQLLLDDWRNSANIINPGVSSNLNAPALNLAGPWLLEIWVHFDLVGYNSLLIWNAFEEIGRFGIAGIMIVVLPFARKRKLSYIVLQLFIGIFFALSHEYIEQFSGLLTSILPPYVFAFVLSSILVEIGLKFGVFTAYISHLLINMFNFNFILYAPGNLMYLNLLFALTASFSAFWLLSKYVAMPHVGTENDAGIRQVNIDSSKDKS